MKDMKVRAEKLLMEAAECEMIAKLSADERKRALFEHLASQYREMSEYTQKAILNRGPDDSSA